MTKDAAELWAAYLTAKVREAAQPVPAPEQGPNGAEWLAGWIMESDD